MLLVTMCGLALAGTIRVDADRPVQVRVNGVDVPFDLRARAATADVDDGVHHLRLSGLDGAPLGEALVAVSGDQEARLTLRGSTLDRLVSARASGGKGSLEVHSLPGSGAAPVVELDGQRVSAPPRGLATSAGAHTLVVRDGASVRFQGTVDVLPGQATRCVVGVSLGCELGALESVARPSEGQPAPTQAPASTAPVTVTFVLKDSFDLSNVYVDGKLVAEFRTNDKEKSTTLAPGVHTVEIKNFTEFETWARGTLVVTPGEPMRVGFDQQSVDVYNRTGAWSPKP